MEPYGLHGRAAVIVDFRKGEGDSADPTQELRTLASEKIAGQIATKFDGVLRGWCKARSDGNPRLVEVVLDGSSVGTFRADAPRPWLKKRGHETTDHGFEVPLPELANHLHRVDVFDVETGKRLRNSPMLFPGASHTPIVYFVHIAKTAGTSFRTMLNECFPAGSVYPNNDDIRQNGHLYPAIDDISTLPIERLRQVHVINGHYPLSVVDRWPLQFHVVTFFRRPAERVLSHVKHLKRNDKRCEHLELEQIYEDRKHVMLNLQLRSLHNRDFASAKHLDVASTAFDEDELRRSLDRIDAIGLVEDFDASIAHISEVLSLDLGSRSKNAFVNQAPADVAVSQTLRETIERETELEQRAYEIIAAEFYGRV